MLRRILDAHGGTLPDDVHVLFANTGKERPETLDFVHEIETRWNVRVRWLEYRNFVAFYRPAGLDETGVRFAPQLHHSYREVSYETAARDGEPFTALIRARSFLPNPVMRICTQELKVRPMKRFALDVGFDHWANIIGMRADEPRRVAKATAPAPERYHGICPLAEAGVTERDVLAFWKAQPFDLRLASYEGNCDLCFLKGRAKIERIVRARPELADWWIEQESQRFGEANNALFRHDRPSYAQMRDQIERSPLLPFFSDIDDDTRPCACTD